MEENEWVMTRKQLRLIWWINRNKILNKIGVLAKELNFSEKDLNYIEEYLEYDEWGLAYEILIEEIIIGKKIVTEEIYNLIISIGKGMGMGDSSKFEEIEKLIDT
ncbi:MafI family immunity protein [Fusobacterium sp. PH5-44]|uniref:MafI family immunity protein n=1 Tax=unclassified Fusobacterium TaxID=2648384 RepID=UPI003D2322C2